MKQVHPIRTPSLQEINEITARLIIPVVAPEKDKTEFRTVSGQLVAYGYSRVLVRECGTLVEIEPWHLEWDNLDNLDIEIKYPERHEPGIDFRLGCHYANASGLYVDGKQVLPPKAGQDG